MLIYSILGISHLATVIFAYLFIQTRWSYYGIARRNHRLQDLLGLFDRSTWNGREALGNAETHSLLGSISSFNGWIHATKPMSSFLTRILYLIGANLVVAYVCWRAFDQIQSGATSWLFVACVLANLFVVVVLYMIDYIHFVARDIS